MGAVENLSFKKVYTLKAQTPIIHFQPDQSGASLRATEVKPKLDRFIRNRLGDQIKADWYVKEDVNALNYRLTFATIGEQNIVDPKDNKDYDIYYGNMSSDDNKKKAVYKKLIINDIKMTVLCTIPELMNAIDSLVAEFFAVTNFGTMQNKGFGSYIVLEQKAWYAPDNIKSALKCMSGAPVCYSFVPSYANNVFKAIKTVYSLMKSGVNFYEYQRSLLFLFMHDEYEIGNEKACLKQEEMVPTNVGKHASEWYRNDSKHETYYVRALLGVGEHLNFINDLKNRKDKTVVNISCVDKDEKDKNKKAVERLASPVFFKVIDDKVYFVANRINEKIYGKEFEFSVKVSEDVYDEINLCVPSKEELGVDFIDKFMAYCVEMLNGRRGLNDSVLQKFNNKQSLIRLSNGIAITEG